MEQYNIGHDSTLLKSIMCHKCLAVGDVSCFVYTLNGFNCTFTAFTDPVHVYNELPLAATNVLAYSTTPYGKHSIGYYQHCKYQYQYSKIQNRRTSHSHRSRRLADISAFSYWF